MNRYTYYDDMYTSVYTREYNMDESKYVYEWIDTINDVCVREFTCMIFVYVLRYVWVVLNYKNKLLGLHT